MCRLCGHHCTVIVPGYWAEETILLQDGWRLDFSSITITLYGLSIEMACTLCDWLCACVHVVMVIDHLQLVGTDMLSYMVLACY